MAGVGARDWQGHRREGALHYGRNGYWHTNLEASHLVNEDEGEKTLSLVGFARLCLTSITGLCRAEPGGTGLFRLKHGVVEQRHKSCCLKFQPGWYC